jgi:glycerol-3-phosphate dehydrogenase
MDFNTEIYDLLVIAGAINGAGIAADAAGRGFNVIRCEMNDLASATSSNSSKLIHGGLRYLEHYEFRLVREALAEHEVLLKKHRILSGRYVFCCLTSHTCALPEDSYRSFFGMITWQPERRCQLLKASISDPIAIFWPR